MGEGFELGNKPIEIISGTPEDVTDLRKRLIQYVDSNAGKGATKYTGPLSAGYDPMTLQSNSILATLMGMNGARGASPMAMGLRGGYGGTSTVTPGSVDGGGSYTPPTTPTTPVSSGGNNSLWNGAGTVPVDLTNFIRKTTGSRKLNPLMGSAYLTRSV